jgi:hypothetical protein
MIWLLFGWLLPCPHSRTTWPQTPTRRGKPVGPCYVICLRCGRQWEYDWENMKIIRKRAPQPEPLPERIVGA